MVEKHRREVDFAAKPPNPVSRGCIVFPTISGPRFAREDRKYGNPALTRIGKFQGRHRVLTVPSSLDGGNPAPSECNDQKQEIAFLELFVTCLHRWVRCGAEVLHHFRVPAHVENYQARDCPVVSKIL